MPKYIGLSEKIGHLPTDFVIYFICQTPGSFICIGIFFTKTINYRSIICIGNKRVLQKRRKSREDYPEIEIQRERFSYDLCPEEARRLIPANITLLEDCGIEYDGITFYAISCRMIQQMQWLGEECGLSYKTDF